MSIFNVFIVNISITTFIIHQSSKNPSKKVFAGFSVCRGNANTTFRWSNEAPPKTKKKNMKIRILLVTIGAAALAAIALNVNASDVLLSPRAAGNQIIVATGVTAAQPAFVAQTATPRALGNQTATVKGTETTVVKCSAIGSPKYLATAGNDARTTCCNRTLAACPVMSTCGIAK